MKSTVKKVLYAVVTAALLVASVFTFASCKKEPNYAENNTEFFIGVSGPLTGPAALYGIAVQNAAQMAVDEINAAGGFEAGGLKGVKIKFVAYDDKHDAANVTTNFSTMYEAGMQASLGCVTTAPCKTFKTLSEDKNVFFITPSASADVVVEYANAYQMCFADSKQGIAAATYVNEYVDESKIGILYRNDDAYSTGILENFKANLDSSKQTVEASFSGDVVTSFASQINILKDCKFIFMPIYYGPASQFMTEAKGIVDDNATYYGCDGLDGIDAVEGFNINQIPQKVSYLTHFVSDATKATGAAKSFIDKYVAKYGSDTLNQFGASAYDCVYALKAALEKCDNITVNSSASDVCEALKNVFQNNFEFSGVTGEAGFKITWDKDGFVSKKALEQVVKEVGVKTAD